MRALKARAAAIALAGAFLPLTLAGAFLSLALVPAVASAAPKPLRSLRHALRSGIIVARHTSGAEVVDLTTGRTLFTWSPNTPRMPASVEKLYTTSTALLRFGAAFRFSTTVLGVGTFDASHTFDGTIYLKGGGDPTFGSQSFDHAAYGGGATMQQLVSNLLRATGITAVQGSIVGDASLFDSARGTAPYGFAASSDIEGQLSALAYDRGFVNANWTDFQSDPALYAIQQFATALKAAGVEVPKGTSVTTGVTPAGAQTLAAVHSPTVGWLIHLTNTPSDNFMAETLLKDIGASYGGGGTTAAGAAVVAAQMATTFGIHPTVTDGSGLSRQDATSPAQVVSLLRAQRANTTFTNSLAVAGETGTMLPGLQGTFAQGRCRGKTGTLHDVANLVGLCTAADGHTLAFAFLMNGVNPAGGHALEDGMAVAVARYDG